jgi:drug/metabolite transporter (DMT)-like permease
MFSALGSLIVAFALASGYFSHPLVVIDPLLSIVLGVVGICFPIVLIAISAPKLPTGLTAIMASSELPSGVICAALIIGEPVSFTMGLGVALVLMGIVVSESDTLFGLLRGLRKRAE